MSKIFIPREVRISEQGKAVALIGSQSTWIADKRVPGDEMKAFLVAFDYDGSRVFIKELRETSLTRPFDPPNAQKVAETEAALAEATPVVQEAAQPVESAPVPNAGNSVATPSAGLPPAPQATNPSVQTDLQSGVAPTNSTSR